MEFGVEGDLARAEQRVSIRTDTRRYGWAVTIVDGESQVRTLREEGVSFEACSNTLSMFDLDDSDLVGVETVSSGVGELTRLQDDGYAYISPSG